MSMAAKLNVARTSGHDFITLTQTEEKGLVRDIEQTLHPPIDKSLLANWPRKWFRVVIEDAA